MQQIDYKNMTTASAAMAAASMASMEHFGRKIFIALRQISVNLLIWDNHWELWESKYFPIMNHVIEW